MEAPKEAGDPSPSCYQAEGGHLRDRGDWKQVPAQGGRKIPSRPPSPSMVPLHNRYGALELVKEAEKDEENEPNKGEDEGPPRPGCSRPGIKTDSKKNPGRVIVVGDSILRGVEGPICRLDPLHR